MRIRKNGEWKFETKWFSGKIRANFHLHSRINGIRFTILSHRLNYGNPWDVKFSRHLTLNSWTKKMDRQSKIALVVIPFCSLNRRLSRVYFFFSGTGSIKRQCINVRRNGFKRPLKLRYCFWPHWGRETSGDGGDSTEERRWSGPKSREPSFLYACATYIRVCEYLDTHTRPEFEVGILAGIHTLEDRGGPSCELPWRLIALQDLRSFPPPLTPPYSPATLSLRFSRTHIRASTLTSSLWISYRFEPAPESTKIGKRDSREITQNRQ